jgi:beta-aspartyl-peptidase (threonine type)
MAASIAVHGGAGRETPSSYGPRRAGVLRAVEAGWAVLERGGSALDAVVAAVMVMEDDPYFNAGLGSVLTADGDVEMDASVMTGDTLGAGAVGVVRGVPNPVRLARAVMDEGREVFVVGEAAVALGSRRGVPTCLPEQLVTPATRAAWERCQEPPGNTVGAVARDQHGHVAAATSTGGVTGQCRGRIGDSAVIGAGTYADDALGAGSATGPGEAIIRLGMVRAALERLARGGGDPADVGHEILGQLERRLDEMAGLILVDPAGRLGIAYSTDTMASAYRTSASGVATVAG